MDVQQSKQYKHKKYKGFSFRKKIYLIIELVLLYRSI